MSLTIGLDVGGTKIAAGVVDAEGHVLAHLRRDSPAEASDAIDQTIAEMVEELTRDHQVEGVGVAAAGLIDRDRSRVLYAPNLAWRDHPLKTNLESRVGLPVVVENDANAAAWGEFTFGAGHDVEDLLLVTVGTGIGGGLVLEGELMRGAFGLAAEIGHIRFQPGGRLCGCGNHGCWEAHASGSALTANARQAVLTGSAEGRLLLERAGGDIEEVTGQVVTAAARDGDPFARSLLDDMARYLGEGIATLVAVLDPAVVALGGGVSDAGDLLLEGIRNAFRAHLTGRARRPEADLRLSSLGNRAGVLGAAHLARR